MMYSPNRLLLIGVTKSCLPSEKPTPMIVLYVVYIVHCLSMPIYGHNASACLLISSQHVWFTCG